jgi:phosphoglycerate kinase
MDLATVPRMEKLDVGGKRVLLRLDFDVPLMQGDITDDARIRAALPTIEYLLERDARVVLLGHLGQPSGKVVPALSMEPVAMRLAELLPTGEVVLTDSPVGDGARRVVLDLRDGQVALLENLRFHAGEEQNNEKFARGLAALGDVYINDACSAIHLAHASIARVPRLVGKRAAGVLLQQELDAFNTLLSKVEHPFLAVIGGARFSDKADLIKSLLGTVDVLIVGGGVANTFLAAGGNAIGRSEIDRDKLPLARELLRQLKDAGVRLLLPTDVVIADDLDSKEPAEVPRDRVPEGALMVDVGAGTRAMFKDAISRCHQVFWNGPLGVCEKIPFREGTASVARAIAGSAAYSVASGDDTVAAVKGAGMEKGFNHVSTGGGALLKLLEGAALPGLQSLVAK